MMAVIPRMKEIMQAKTHKVIFKKKTQNKEQLHDCQDFFIP